MIISSWHHVLRVVLVGFCLTDLLSAGVNPGQVRLGFT